MRFGVVGVLGLVVPLAGCVAEPAPSDIAAVPDVLADLPGYSVSDCLGTLHVWLVPIERLEAVAAPDFPPEPYRGAPLGRFLYYMTLCPGTDGTSFGFVGYRTTPPEPLAEEGAIHVYMLEAHANDDAVVAAWTDAGLPTGRVRVAMSDETTPLEDLLTRTMRVEDEEGLLFSSTLTTVPPVEVFDPPHRFFYETASGARFAIGGGFTSELREAAAEDEYADGSWFDEMLGGAPANGGDWHVLQQVGWDLTTRKL
ncbi:MAG: hypothetical protein ACT4PT_11085 [Methanobacteriota archaeon]